MALCPTVCLLTCSTSYREDVCGHPCPTNSTRECHTLWLLTMNPLPLLSLISWTFYLHNLLISLPILCFMQYDTCLAQMLHLDIWTLHLSSFFIYLYQQTWNFLHEPFGKIWLIRCGLSLFFTKDLSILQIFFIVTCIYLRVWVIRWRLCRLTMSGGEQVLSECGIELMRLMAADEQKSWMLVHVSSFLEV